MSSNQILHSRIDSVQKCSPLIASTYAQAIDMRELLRLPPNGKLDGLFSLSRSKWNQLILPCKENNFRPPIKSISLRNPGAIRGVRLIVVSSARAYFQGLLDAQEAVVDTPLEATPTLNSKRKQKTGAASA